MRDLINRGAMIGPRMFVAGHGLSRRARAPASPPDPLRPMQQARRRARSRGRLGRDQGLRLARQLRQRRHDADVHLRGDEGHRRRGARLGKQGRDSFVRRLRRARTRSARAPIPSSTAIDLDDETIAEMVERGTVWVPTIDHNRYYVGREGRVRLHAARSFRRCGTTSRGTSSRAARVQGGREDRHGLGRRVLRCSARTRASSGGSSRPA